MASSKNKTQTQLFEIVPIMESTSQSDHETYRAVVLRQDVNEVLLALAGDSFCLPWVGVPRRQRIAEMRTRWDLDIVCLFSPNLDGSSESPDWSSCQVTEFYGPSAESILPMEWVRVADLSATTFDDAAEYFAVQRSLSECIAPSDHITQGSFAKLGWFRELQGWIEEGIGPVGLHLTRRRFVQLNASPTFSLVRFGTNGAAVWFKAVGSPNVREFPRTLALARHLPKYLSPILATRPECNGWLALEAQESNLGEAHEAQSWNIAASFLAKLQIESTEISGLIMEFGARDLRTPALLWLIIPFLNAIGQLMDMQTKTPSSLLARSEVTVLSEQAEEALSLGTKSGMPDGLGHLDLNPGNVIVSAGDSIFLDWADAHVGNPLFSLQYLSQRCRRVAAAESAIESGLTGAFLDQSRSLVSPESFAEAMAVALLLAVFAYALASGSWNDSARLQDPEVAAYLRSLTRRMHREATRLRDRRALCPIHRRLEWMFSPGPRWSCVNQFNLTV
jgi:hypothetical protein